MELTEQQERMLDATVVVPDHVVYRQFAEETIAVNLDSGKYHGLNEVAGRMIAALGGGTAVRAVADEAAAQFGVPVEQVQRDVAQLCVDLADRGLIEVHAGGAD